MRHLIRIARSNVAPRLLVGALLAWFLYQGLLAGKTEPQFVQASPLGPTIAMANMAEIRVDQLDRKRDTQTADILALAQTDHVALLERALVNYERRVQAFTATFGKQERINGKLKPAEKIAIKFKDEPFSLLMQWQENAGRIDKLLYVEGSNDDQMIVHPAGLLAWIKSVKRDPTGPEARKSSRRTCNQFGFRRTLVDMLEVYRQAQAADDLEIASLGRTQHDGRECVSFERRLPAKEQYPCARMVIDFDLEYLLPVAVSSYDWQGNMVSRYTYADLNFNTTLTSTAFTPAANGL